MKKIIQQKGESRKKYLVRVAIAMLEENGMEMAEVEYDEAKCDALCLADDLRIEFNIPEEDDEDDDDGETGILRIPKKNKTKKKK